MNFSVNSIDLSHSPNNSNKIIDCGIFNSIGKKTKRKYNDLKKHKKMDMKQLTLDNIFKNKKS